MFCPDCGKLSFPDPNGLVNCPDPYCNPDGKMKKVKEIEIGDKMMDLSTAVSSSKPESRDRRVIEDADQQRGVLTTKTYICPKCDLDKVYAELQQTRASDEPETRILTCSECGHGWREY